MDIISYKQAHVIFDACDVPIHGHLYEMYDRKKCTYMYFAPMNVFGLSAFTEVEVDRSNKSLNIWDSIAKSQGQWL